MRHPRIAAACLAYARAERRHGPTNFAQRRANTGPDPRVSGDGVRVEIVAVPVDLDGNGATIDLVVYRPAGDSPRPVHLHLHGGAFNYGSTRDVDSFARELVRSGFVVVSPEYRLAPESAWPTPVEDVYAALAWTSEHAAEIGGEPGRLSIGGSSAGGCLAAATALVARDRGAPPLAGQLLDIPITDLTMSTGDSMERFARGYLLTRHHLAESYARYVPDPADRGHPYASPLLAPDLAGLPPTVLLTAEFDPLRDEGEEYGRRLRAAGVPVTAIRARHHVHASTHTPMPSARRYREAVVDALREVQDITTTRWCQ